jgi:hypothetical protein
MSLKVVKKVNAKGGEKAFRRAAIRALQNRDTRLSADPPVPTPDGA